MSWTPPGSPGRSAGPVANARRASLAPTAGSGAGSPGDHTEPSAPTAPAGAGGPTPSTVLLVDDDEMLLAGLRRNLHAHKARWSPLAVTSGEEALRVLAAQPIDVVVSDLRMRTMNGTELLTHVRDQYPGTARIILSGYADVPTVVSAVGPAQQVLIRPCRHDELLTALDRVLSLRDLVADPGLRDLLGGVTSLPTPPKVYQDITRITADPDYTLDAIIEAISTDLAVVTEVLRLINSSFFGLSGHVDSLARAVTLLGPSTIQALAISSAAFGSASPPPGLDSGVLASHGLHVGGLARRVGQAEGWDASAVSDIFMAGLLHQIGLPILAAAHPRAWAELRGRAAEQPEILIDPWAQADAEQRAFSCTGPRASAYLLGLWGFPRTVVRAIADQPARPDDPAPTPAGQLLTYARVRHHDGQLPGTGVYLDPARLARWDQSSRAGSEASA